MISFITPRTPAIMLTVIRNYLFVHNMQTEALFRSLFRRLYMVEVKQKIHTVPTCYAGFLCKHKKKSQI